MPTVVCGKCGTPFQWQPGQKTATCPKGHLQTLRDVRMTTEREWVE